MHDQNVRENADSFGMEIVRAVLLYVAAAPDAALGYQNVHGNVVIVVRKGIAANLHGAHETDFVSGVIGEELVVITCTIAYAVSLAVKHKTGNKTHGPKEVLGCQWLGVGVWGTCETTRSTRYVCERFDFVENQIARLGV